MKVTYNKEEIEKIIFDALCNGLGELSACGISLEVREKLYKDTKNLLAEMPEWKNKTISMEDVFMQMLKEDKLKFVDVEGGDGDFVEITFDMAMENINNCKEEFSDYPMNCHKELGDAWDACNTLQIMLYKDLIYG